MNRRRFLLTGIGVVAGGALASHVVAERQLGAFAAVDVVPRLLALKGRTLISTGAWQPAQIFAHLAQSIEFSIDGYPQAKPLWFQHTLGRAAFGAFSVAGAMRHNLAEAIPGAPALHGITDTEQALERLLTAWQRFDEYGGALAPHFAYGELDKRQYRAAHLMHIENHLQGLQA